MKKAIRTIKYKKLMWRVYRILEIMPATRMTKKHLTKPQQKLEIQTEAKKKVNW